MARHAVSLGLISDLSGDEWEVRENRETPHGFAVALGWPSGEPRGRGGAGGPRVILTAPLCAYLEDHRDQPSTIRLPIGRTAIKRLRQILGHHWRVDRVAWWEERVDDLSDLTIEAFAAKHQVSTGAVVNARHAFFYRALRPAGWWRQPDVAAVILADRPRSDIASDLGISIGSVGRLRYALNHKSVRGIAEPEIARESLLREVEAGRVSQSEAGRRLGVSQQLIWSWIDRRKTEREPSFLGRRNTTREMRALALHRIAQGESATVIARELGVSRAAISKWKAKAQGQ